MKNYKVDTLILGATYYGCGLAKAIPGAVVIENSMAPGSDYAYGFDGGKNWYSPLKNAEAEEFRRELIERKALSEDGRAVTGAFTPVFASWCIRHDIRPYFGLELAEKSGNTLKFVDFCGNFVTFEANRILDARSFPKNGRRFTACVVSEKEIADGRYGFFDVTAANTEKVYYISIDVESDTSYQSARQRFASVWETALPAELTGAKLMLTAARFSESLFDNPAAALDAGLSGILPEREVADTAIVQTKEFDVVICGVGTAGVIASISAARHGVKVLAIDKASYPGGVWTGGFIPWPYIQTLTGEAAAARERADRREGYFHITENLKMELDISAIGYGGTIYYATPLCGCEKENNRVTAIICRNADGQLVRVKAKSFIDATSEALLCRMAGAETIRGREIDEEFNSYTNTMGVFRGDNFGAANFDAGRVAQYDFEDLSKCYLETYNVHLKDDYSTLNFCVQVSDNPGLREGDHIVIEKPWTLGEYFASGGKCEDNLFTVISNLDTHAQDIFFESEIFQDWNIAASCWEIRIDIPVPMRVLFPKGVDGVIAPARHLGVDHDLGCAIRMIPALTALGEISGAIAAKAVKEDILPADVKYSDIVSELPANPEMNKNEQAKWGNSDRNAAWSSASDEEIVKLLKSSDPALGIWNIKQQNKPQIARQVLAEAEPGSSAACSAAFGLALLNDSSVIPLLEDIVKSDDRTHVNANLRFSAERRIAAVYLLGRLRKAETADFLIGQLAKRDCEKFFGHTVMALLKIGDANESAREKISSVLKEIAEDTSWQMIEQLKGAGAGLRRSDGLLRLRIARTLDSWQISHSIKEKMASLKLDSHEAWLLKNYQR